MNKLDNVELSNVYISSGTISPGVYCNLNSMNIIHNNMKTGFQTNLGSELNNLGAYVNGLEKQLIYLVEEINDRNKIISALFLLLTQKGIVSDNEIQEVIDSFKLAEKLAEESKVSISDFTPIKEYANKTIV